MDRERKRQLKAAGKAEVQRRSAELYAAMDAANPAQPGDAHWAENYRQGRENKRWLMAGLPTLRRAQWEPLFVALPYEANRWIPVVGGYLQCQGCGSVAPVALPWRFFYWSNCECGNVRWRCLLGWRRLRVRDAHSIAPVKMIGKGMAGGSPDSPESPADGGGAA